MIGLFVTGEYVSVPASVGFIALWGIAVLNGVVLVSASVTCVRMVWMLPKRCARAVFSASVR
ncbi:hypothetical protein J4711_13905 [Staphylococcus epidermidis]|nr:hypothetical protein [Staphylococcus epidermidis]